jgi:hypothetical protein
MGMPVANAGTGRHARAGTATIPPSQHPPAHPRLPAQALRVSGDDVTFKGRIILRKVPLDPLRLGPLQMGPTCSPGTSRPHLSLSLKLLPGRATDASGERQQVLLQGVDALPWALQHGVGTTAYRSSDTGMFMRNAPLVKQGRNYTRPLGFPTRYSFSLVTTGSLALGAWAQREGLCVRSKFRTWRGSPCASFSRHTDACAYSLHAALLTA